MGELKKKKILVTGGAGFIGYHLCKRLSTITPNVTIYDNMSNGKTENVKDAAKLKFVKDDILNAKKLYALEKADLIYHLAAQVVVPYSMENPLIDFETNAKGTLHVLEKARKDDAKVVFASVPLSMAIQHSCRLLKSTVFILCHAMVYPRLSAKNIAACTKTSMA